MHDHAFKILGIEPTKDGRVIRAAYLRLARIYHPDRFADQPEDVRFEAERRMREATEAYQALREAKPAARIDVPDEHIQERKRKFREALEARQAQEEKDRARWRRWDQIEAEARARAELEAEIAATIARDVGIVPDEPRASETPANGRKSGSLLTDRLDAARRGETSPLVRATDE